MKSNVGGIDRTLRIVVGLLLIGLGAAGTLGTWSWIVGLILAATGVFRFCGLYTLIGVNTCKLEQRGGSA